MPVLSQRKYFGAYFSIVFVFLGYFIAIKFNYQEKSQQKNMWRCKTRTVLESILSFSKTDNSK